MSNRLDNSTRQPPTTNDSANNVSQSPLLVLVPLNAPAKMVQNTGFLFLALSGVVVGDLTKQQQATPMKSATVRPTNMSSHNAAPMVNLGLAGMNSIPGLDLITRCTTR